VFIIVAEPLTVDQSFSAHRQAGKELKGRLVQIFSDAGMEPLYAFLDYRPVVNGTITIGHDELYNVVGHEYGFTLGLEGHCPRQEIEQILKPYFPESQLT
jgi:hypothetical protein